MRARLSGIGHTALVLSLSLGVTVLPVAPDLGVSRAEARGGGGGGEGGGGGSGGGGGAGGGSGNGQGGEQGGRGGGNDFGQGVAAAARGDNPSRGEGRGGAEAGARGGDRGALASQLGALNAAHASLTARANAAPNSRVGMIATYERAMLAALTLPAVTPQEITARNEAIAAALATLDAAANRSPVTTEVVAAVNALLGLPATP